METLAPATQDDSSGANPSSVKSDDSSPRHESGRGSPPPNCAICLGTCRNNSFTDSCLHQFCFKCLLTWSKVKPECPLCKQTFRSIIHNVRSNHQYEEYMVEQRQTEEAAERIDINTLTSTRRFRYRTTLTLPRRESLAIQQLLLHYPMMADVLPAPRPAPRAPRRRSPASFRRTVYRHNLWARPLPDFTGRFRDCSPLFYRYNDSQMHRLVPWLTRELHYLLNENVGHISYVITRILELLPQYHINSPEFREAMLRYFGDRTDHFLHELYCFASTPYDMTGYDRNYSVATRRHGKRRHANNSVYKYNDSQMHRLVRWLTLELHYLLNENVGHISYVITRILELLPQYHINSPEFREAMLRYFGDRTDHFHTRISTMVNEVISSSESEASTDSDIVMVSSSEPAEQPPGPSRVPAPVYPQNYIPETTTNNVILIETLSHTDTDDDSSEVMVVGYIKPPQDRTPEVVDLLGSDSDVIVQENVPETSQSHDTESRPSGSLVKLSLKRHKPPVSDSDSESDAGVPPPSKRKRRHRSNDTATTSDTCRTTPSPAPSPAPASSSAPSPTPTPTPTPSFPSPPLAALRRSPSLTSTSSNCSEPSAWSSGETYCSTNKRKRLHKKKPKKKCKEAPVEKSKKKPKKRSTRQQKEKNATNSTADNEKSKKRKSDSGKGVKSSKKAAASAAAAAAEASAAAADLPGTSGVSARRQQDKDRKAESRRPERESRRLKSVVNVVNGHKNSSDSNSSASPRGANDTSAVINSVVANSSSCQRSHKLDVGRRTVITQRYEPQSAVKYDTDGTSDSEDDLPLNLTVKRSACS
ncbi:E3 ubiquitin-protein ligase Topors [Papilio machaon]|uniref:E3 ubiquitin-protein ligase Topors n=1 Tax=Papilio machaon TaxID=76193 RepID=A0A0N1IPV4_PAPMA|nr:E3 ubiquitin-protein ligase Topors [Papilio machaon]